MGNLNYRLDMLKKPTWKFVNASQFAKDNLLYIQEAGHFCSGKKYYTKRTKLDSYLILITLSGLGILDYCGERYSLVPGSAAFIDCRQMQYYYTAPETAKWEVIWVHLNGVGIKPYYERFIEKNNNSNLAIIPQENTATEIIDNIIRISEDYSKDRDNEIIADNLLNSLLKELITKSGTYNISVPNLIKEVAYYLRHNYREEINLDYLAKEFNISKFHLQRSFKQAFGTSPAKYLTNVRLNHAKRLLRGTTLSVNEISEQIGMEPNYFIQLFKSSEKETPKQYRNNWAGNTNI